MKKTAGRWLFLIGALTLATLVIIWLSYANINTRTVYAENGRLTLTSGDIANGFTLLDGQLLVSDGALTPVDTGTADWYLSRDLRSDNNMDYHTYSLSLTVADSSDICFLVLQPATVRIWINGNELPTEELQSNHIYHFSEFDSGKMNKYSILLQIGESTTTRDHYHGLMFGTQEQLINVMMAWVSSGMIAVGVCLLLLIQSFALYIQKRSESYLLILALIVLQGSLRGIDIAIYPLLSIFWSGAELSEFADTLFRLTLPLNLLLLTRIFPQDIGKKEWVVGILISAGGIICAGAELVSLQSIALWGALGTYYLEIAMLFLEAICILKSFMRDRYGSRVLLVGVLAYMIGRVFAMIISRGVVPVGIVDTYYYPWQYAALIYMISYVIAIDGIFARKFSEADILSVNLQRVNANLELIVAQRTAKLEETNHKLAESNQALIQFQQAKQVFLGNVVHNLRTPLFTLGGTVEMLQEDAAGYPQFAPRLQKVTEKIGFLQRMINELFLVVRFDDGRVSFDMKQQDLNALLTQTCLDYQPKAERKDLLLQTFLPENPVPVVFDGLYLRQAIENILDNAIRHSAVGRPIQVSMNLEEDLAQITITNYGEPIAPEDLPHIFKRYYKGKDSKPEQTGLGLSIAQEIVQRHGGTISVQTDQNGTCFTICLPVVCLVPA